VEELESKWASYLGEGLEERFAADYDAEGSFSRQDAESECDRSRDFLDRIALYLQTKGLAENELQPEG
jgi:hypothetical protein